MKFEELKEIIADVLGVEEGSITRESDLINDLEADSLSIMELNMEIEEQAGVQIPEELVTNIHTVQDILDVIETNK